MSKYPGRIISNLAPAGYSVYFDGTGDYLSVANNAALNVGSGDFCIEAWFNVSTVASQQSIVSNAGASGSDNTQIDIVSGNIRFASSATVWLTGNAVTTNVWNHVVVSRSGTTMSLFLNGSRQATATNSTNFANANNYATIVGGYPPSTALFTGYISNVRIVKGSSVYDPTQTTLRVPTQLLNITNTSLLTCQSPAIIDNSTNAFAITANGNAVVSTLTPFPAYVPYNPALGASTPGVWTLDEAMQAAATRQWNMYDPYFNLTTLLLHGNQPAGVTDTNNNTFKDSSSNNFTITRNGNTTQGSFSPFSLQSGTWSVFFNAANFTDIYAASSADFNFGSGDFTIECFFNSSNAMSTATFYRLFDTGQLSCFFYNGSIYLRNASAQELVTPVAHGLSVGVWYHLAIVRSGNTYSIYRDGSLLTSLTPAAGVVIANASAPFVIGTNTSWNQPLSGHVSNFRVTTGQALYTTTFTPTTSPLTTTSQSATASNVKLLTCQSNRFVDNSTQNTKTILFGDNGANPGTRFIQSFSPFLPTVAYTPQTIGGSGFFDGTGDYLSSATSTDLQLGSSDFSLEWWEYRTAANNVDTAIVCGDGTFSALLGYYNSGAVRFYLSTTGSSWNVFSDTSAGTTASNSWNHFVLTRSGTAFRVFLNGVLGAYATGSGSVTQTTNQIFISGGINGSSAPIEGYMSGVRFVKGSIPTTYQTSSTTTGTSIFTSPTAPVTTTSQGATSGDVKYLVNFTNAGVVDSTGDNVLETVGNAQISTTQSKFGGSSMFFDGSGDYLQIRRTNLLLPVANQDFTFECWVYPTATPGGQGATIMGAGEYGTDDNWNVNINSSLQVSLYIWSANNSYTNTTRTVTVNAWNHIAVARFGTGTNNLKVFVNGIGQSFSVNNTLVGPVRNFSIGADENGDESVYTGYIDELRFTLGVGRYTADFTPQTSQWQDQ